MGVVDKAFSVAYSYLLKNYSKAEIAMIEPELQSFMEVISTDETQVDSYENLQNFLSKINEKESGRKERGIYYTPRDVVGFVVANCSKLPTLNETDLGVPSTFSCPQSFLTKTVYDPTCGTGEFLVEVLEMKLGLLGVDSQILKTVGTIRGNDLNPDSVAITKLRLLLCVLSRFGAKSVVGLSEVLNKNFTTYDYVSTCPAEDKYDVILGDPPYVEDSKSETTPEVRYGNIYANVLENSAKQLEENGIMGFVVPLSYVSTSRMKSIRTALSKLVPEQYVLTYSDRPSCLFTSAHQKICLLFGRKIDCKPIYYTSSYNYWYKEERKSLFENVPVVKNEYVSDLFIPKFGSKTDLSIYSKVLSQPKSLPELFDGSFPVYLNMGAQFWIKAFTEPHGGAGYKVFNCRDEETQKYVMCLLNSSLFWWYWSCISDCWHVTQKELAGFRVPVNFTPEVIELADNLEQRLEQTKVYVGTAQIDYEYKHKNCMAEIEKVDDYVNKMYGILETENLYIKDFARRYRTSGGTK